jgi:hypothetical protein
MQQAIPDDSKDLPLEEAYRFGKEQGIEDEVNVIRNMVIDHGPSYAAWIRRACIITLFKNMNIYEKFKRVYWPNGDTADGETRINVYYEAKQFFDDSNNFAAEEREKEKAEKRSILGIISQLFSFFY